MKIVTIEVTLLRYSFSPLITTGKLQILIYMSCILEFSVSCYAKWRNSYIASSSSKNMPIFQVPNIKSLKYLVTDRQYFNFINLFSSLKIIQGAGKHGQ